MGAGALDGLFQIIAGEQAETNGQAGLQGNLRDALGGFGTDVVEMGSAAADDGTQGNNAAVLGEGGIRRGRARG